MPSVILFKYSLGITEVERAFKCSCKKRLVSVLMARTVEKGRTVREKVERRWGGGQILDLGHCKLYV